MPADNANVLVAGSEEEVGVFQKKPVKERWPLWKLAILASPQLGVQVLWCFIGPNSAPYMLHLGMTPSMATLNNIAGPITGFFTGPFVGSLSDNLTSKWGRRRPVILFGLISLWVAGVLFSGAEHVLGENSIMFAAPMYWVLDITINILQTPHRALVSDLAEADQQVPMQVVFVIFMAIGNFMGFRVMQIFPVAIDHMLPLMIVICTFNTVLVGIQFVTAKETPLRRDPDAPKMSLCSPVTETVKAVKDSPPLLFHLAVIQSLVWMALTAWNGYGGQWFSNSVYAGDSNAPEGSLDKQHFAEGMAKFAEAGQFKGVAQLITSLVIITVLLKTNVKAKFVYAPCILLGAIFSVWAAGFVGHNGFFAEICFIMSVLPETGSFAVPFGIVAKLNEQAAAMGKPVSTALQMALLNCCITIGQQVCTMTLSAIEMKVELEEALPMIFFLAAGALGIAFVLTLLLKDKDMDVGASTSSSEGESSNEEQSSSDE